LQEEPPPIDIAIAVVVEAAPEVAVAVAPISIVVEPISMVAS
jgi:hypothetical protein